MSTGNKKYLYRYHSSVVNLDSISTTSFYNFISSKINAGTGIKTQN